MFKTRRPIPGQAPATLTPHLVGGKARKPEITLIEYDGDHLEEHGVENVSELLALLDNTKVTWINIDGLGDVDALRVLGEKFQLHPLALEDVLNTGQRPKTEPYDRYLFIVVQMVYQDATRKMCGEQVSLFLGDNFLISVQEEAEFDVFEPVRQRIRAGRGAIRRSKADYLAYALLDSIIDHYYPVLESIGSAIEEIESGLFDQPSREMVRSLHEHKRTLTQLRRFIWPVRDVVSALLHDATGQISEGTKLFLRDCYDHTVQLMDLVESYRDVSSGLMDLYLSSVGLRTNETMRVLTVITAIFIPLTFLAGIYGMNFQPDAPATRTLPLNMPELYHPYGYLGALLFMALIAAGQLILFKKKKWL
ncbi:MAG: magnesium/cobalt transporter CorA [Verrucomicrobiota bacterium]|nr:magnesium/cobalt transporter CorA [Verrucomicrobiota bacterium]